MSQKLSKLHHTADELRYVAKLLDVLNEDHESIGIEPSTQIDVYWADVRMGIIMVPHGDQQFAYYPVAEGDRS